MMSGPSEGIHVADVANPVYRFRDYRRWHVRHRSLVADIASGFGVDECFACAFVVVRSLVTSTPVLSAAWLCPTSDLGLLYFASVLTPPLHPADL